MSRKPSEKSLAEYEALDRFFTHWLTVVNPAGFSPLGHPHHPLSVHERFKKTLTFSESLSGLKQAVNDILEGVEDWNAEALRLADASLRNASAPTLSQLLLQRRNVLGKLIRRGIIRDEAEYYLVSQALADTHGERSSADVERLGAAVIEFESRVRH